MRIIKYITWTFAWLAAFVCATWAAGALFFDFPTARAPAAILFLIVLVAAVIFLRGRLLKLAAIFAAFAVVALWWLTLKPSNDRPWQPDVAATAWAEINGDDVTIYNVRNCDYRTENDFTTHWESRKVRLSQISGLDLALNYWGSR
jgi:hypothetical protein